MNEPKQEIKNISEIVELKNLTIPPYQRPYKWKSENVTQLLDDIFEHIITKNKLYRIGSLILHADENELNIVDGQQRLTTISILLYSLGEVSSLLLNRKYKHKISTDNIVYNARVIQNWINSKFNENDKAGFKNQLLNKCEFVLFTVYDQDEAFQLFDSQNARGKELEPYDLLKAFHLREMEFDSEKDKELAVKRWEKSVDDGTLKPILGNHLFKIRKWTRTEWRYDFTKNDIEEFKGISLHQKQQYPFESTLRMLDGFVANAQNDKFLKNQHIAQSYPFSITMPIINGKRFFEYVDFYIKKKESLLNEKEQPKLNHFYNKRCLNYSGSGRSGDEKVRNLYENILLFFIDKFEYTEDFVKFYEAFYKVTYIIRCDNKKIRLETILISPAIKILQEINNAVSPDKLRKYQYKKYKIIATDFAMGIGEIIKYINNEH